MGGDSRDDDITSEPNAKFVDQCPTWIMSDRQTSMVVYHCNSKQGFHYHTTNSFNNGIQNK